MINKQNHIDFGSYIKNVKANAAHRLFCNRALTSSPLETRDNGVLDFVEVLDSFGLVDEQVGTIPKEQRLACILTQISLKVIPSSVGSETPNLPGIGNIPTVLIRKNPGTGLEIITGANLAGLDVLRYLIG